MRQGNIVLIFISFTAGFNVVNTRNEIYFIENVKRGSIQELLHSLQDYPRQKAELIPYYKEIYEDTTPNWKFPSVRNLEKYLSPFSHCFVHVTNYQNVDFTLQSTIPAVVRYQLPTKITTTQFSKNEILTWAPKGINLTGGAIENYSEFDCPFSQYLKDDVFSNGICSSINKRKLSLNIRPWNCEVTVVMFPPLFLFAWRYFHPFKWRHILPINLSFPPVWNHAEQAGYYMHHFESNVFHVWIMDELFEQEWYTRLAIEWEKNNFKEMPESAIIYDTFTILQTLRFLDTNPWRFDSSQLVEKQHHIVLAQQYETLLHYSRLNVDKVNVTIANLYRSRYVATSELFQLIGRLLVLGYKSDLPSIEYEKLERLFNYTKLLPNFDKFHNKIMDEVGPLPAKKVENYFIEFHSSLRKWQEQHIFEVLKGCNKVAVILPAFTGHQMAKNLTEVENLADVYVGKEVLYERAFKMEISGSVSINQVMRAKLVVSSGIWNFWLQIFWNEAMFQEDTSSEKQLVAPSLSGNISVVFAVIIFGIVCSTAVFVIEIREIMYSFVVVILSSIRIAFTHAKESFLSLARKLGEVCGLS
ncbi:unnamed protein product [Orchesella dallaii]|uniref:Uncharacterized protein n=1 Tax=Orchesella dallaii TaxID=48710 RepID=A0ABP1QCE5_9HEXA